MATWKKVIVSGSNISQLNNDSDFLLSSGDGIISSSAQIGTSISGSATALSSSIAGRVTTNTTNATALDGEVTSLMGATGSYALADNISGSFTAASSSLATRVTANEAFSSSLDASFASEAELNTVSASVKTFATDADTTLSASLASTITSNTTTTAALDGEVTNLMAATGSAYSHIANLNTYTGSAGLKSAISGSSTALSASIASDVATNKNNATALDGEVTNLMAATGSQYTHITNLNAFTGSFTTVSGSIQGRLTTVEGNVGAGGLLSSSAQIATDISGSSTALSSSIAGRVTTNEVEIDALQAFSQSVDTALNFNGADVTVSGNLTVAGTTTTVDSTTVDIGDNIIALNGTGATKGGLAVNDANGPSSGSLLWDGTNNYWVEQQELLQMK